MLFNSGEFLNFFLAFLFLYWLVRHNLRARNILIVLASYLFYGWWDYRFLALILFSSVLDYFVGLGIAANQEPFRRKTWLALSIVANLTILGFFKYYDFFVSSLADLFGRLGLPFETRTLEIILPVGISFYTFQAMSYTIDVYRGRVAVSRNLINFLAFVSFFPQLVAGPIERASHLLPQFEQTRIITAPMLREGIWLTLWGMFKKVAIADNLDPLVRLVYDSPSYTAPIVILGAIAFAIQIYCDFSGYSDIARGTARVLGFDIMVNFNIPYAATNLREFWSRWHISLSTWLRDYLYISLGGNRRGKARTYLNLFLTMLLGGLWHGASWNFVLWGMLHGFGLTFHRAVAPNKSVPRMVSRRLISWFVTMMFVLYGWLLFRAHGHPTMGPFEQIVAMTSGLANFSAPLWSWSYIINLAAFTFPLLLMETWQLKCGDQLASLSLSRWPLAILEGALLLGIIMFWERNELAFIYFQF